MSAGTLALLFLDSGHFGSASQKVYVAMTADHSKPKKAK